jgi:large subunit ribosomal protein L13
MNKHTIDAAGKVPGRIATEVAVLLMGKNRVDYARNAIPDVKVEVNNADQMWIDAKKKVQKTYAQHSGYPGGLKTESVEQVIAKSGQKEILKKAIYGMLPKNKLRPLMMNNLTIND